MLAKEQRLPSLTALRAFYHVAKHGSMQLAAVELCVSPTAISHQIRSLESDLQIKLFVRKVRALELTLEAHRLYATLDKVFAELHSCVSAIRPKPCEAFIQVAASPLFASKWLLPKLPEFETRHPDIQVRVLTVPIIDLAQIEADVVFRYCGSPLTDPMYHAHSLFDVRLEPVCSPGFFDRYPSHSVEELMSSVLLHDEGAGQSDWVPDWSSYFEAHGLTSQSLKLRGRSFSNAYMVMESAVAGHGWALGISAFIQDDIRQGRLVSPLKQCLETPSQYRMFTRREAESPPSAKAFSEWVSHLPLS